MDYKFFLLEFKMFFREHVIRAIVIVVLMLLFPVIIIPEIRFLFEVRSNITQVENRLTALKTKRQRLETLDREKLARDVRLTSLALPSDKDNVYLILDALELVSSESDVGLGRYSISPGTGQKGPSVAGIPYIQIKINVKADREQLSLFLQNLSQVLPLTKVDAITSTNKDSALTLSFFYKPETSTLPALSGELPALHAKYDEIIEDLSNRSNVNLAPQPLEEPIESLPTTPQTTDRSNPFF